MQHTKVLNGLVHAWRITYELCDRTEGHDGTDERCLPHDINNASVSRVTSMHLVT